MIDEQDGDIGLIEAVVFESVHAFRVSKFCRRSRDEVPFRPSKDPTLVQGLPIPKNFAPVQVRDAHAYPVRREAIAKDDKRGSKDKPQ
jgi:hypothetical protein